MAALGAGVGLIIAGLTEVSDLPEKFIGPLQYLTLPISGCFFLLDWLPSQPREIILYFPLVHAFETFRKGYFGPDIVTYGDPAYGFACALVLIGLGAIGVRIARDRVE